MKILIGSSISQIAISETSHKQPPPISDHHLSLTSRVVTYGRFHCIVCWYDREACWNFQEMLLKLLFLELIKTRALEYFTVPFRMFKLKLV